MICVLHHTSTDNCHYWVSSQLFIEAESIEALYCQLLDMHNNHVDKYNLVINDENYKYSTATICGEDIQLSDISEDMRLESLDDYINNIKVNVKTL